MRSAKHKKRGVSAFTPWSYYKYHIHKLHNILRISRISRLEIDVSHVQPHGENLMVWSSSLFSADFLNIRTNRNRPVTSTLSDFSSVVKVKQSIYRPQRLQEVETPRIPRHPANEGVKVVSPMHQPPLLHRRYPWYSFLLEAESIQWPKHGRNN